MNIVLLSRDLMLTSRLEGAARQLDVELMIAADGAAAVALCVERSSRLLIVDLRLPGLDVAELISQLQQQKERLPLLACGPHVHEMRLAEARRAGCDLVVTRGQLDREAENLLRPFCEGEG